MYDKPFRSEREMESKAGPKLDVEVVIPVLNEERVLAATVTRVHQFLTEQSLLRWQITIAENGSSDATPELAQSLAAQLPAVQLLHLDAKGRGRALRAAWSTSTARVVCYMDADLSTDLRALLPLIAPLLSADAEVSIGSRLARESRTMRTIRRELISRSYNWLLKLTLRARFADAQCGFKAVRADVVLELLDAVRDDGWFFDTELLIAAQRRGMRIHEVPVDWVEDLDSTVKILPTALHDLRGIARLMLTAVRPGAGRRPVLGRRGAQRAERAQHLRLVGPHR
jgi:glycosyltransferase involved in cell wall biosynthesis